VTIYTLTELADKGALVADENVEQLAVKDRNLEEIAAIVYYNPPDSKVGIDGNVNLDYNSRMPLGVCFSRISLLCCIYNVYLQ